MSSHERAVRALKEAGYGKFIDLILTDPRLYDREGRLNRYLVAFEMDCTVIEIDRMMEGCREVVNRLSA